MTGFLEWGAANMPAYVALLGVAGLILGLGIVYVRRRF